MAHLPEGLDTERALIPCFLSALLISVPLVAQASPGAFTSAEAQALDRVAQAELKALGAPGMMLAVVRQDGVAYLKAYGTASVETGEPMAPDMLGSVASLTKLVTATTAAVLAAEGKLDLDTPIKVKLPWLPERLGRLTMTQLLSHSSGLSDAAHPGLPPAGDGTLAGIGRAFRETFLFEPGTQWSYSNAGYVLAGCVIEATTGVPYPAAMSRTLLQPLKMAHSTFDPRFALTWPHAQGHDTRGSQAKISRPYNLSPSPAGGLGSTVSDLARLARALMADGMLDGQRVLPMGVLARLTQIRGHGGAYLGGTRDYGFGLFLRDHHGLRIMEHEGLLSGFGASFAMAPERGIAAIALCNGRMSAPCRTTQAALEIATGLAPSSTEPAYRPIPAGEAVRLTGRYSDGAGSELEIRVVNGQLGAWEKDRLYPIVARKEGHLEIQGYPDLLPVPATPLELVPGDPARPQELIRVMWGVLRRTRF